MMALVFGRKKDEGGIPGLGSSSGSLGTSARASGIPGTGSEQEPARTAPTTGAARPAYAGSSPALGASTPAEPWEIGPWTIRLFVLLFIAAFAVLFTTTEQDRLHDPAQRASRGDITYKTADSLIKHGNLTKALAALKAKSPANATVESLRITPTRIDATVAQSDGAQFELSVDPAFKVTKDTYPASEPEGLPFSKIPTAVPERLLATTESKLGLKAADLDYILLNPSTSIDGTRDDDWGLYYSKPPLHNDATATLAGKDVRLLGTPDAATRASMRNSARTTLTSLNRAEAQVKSSNFPNEAMRQQALKTIREARARAKQSLKEAGQ